MMSRDVSIGGINAATGDESAASGVERRRWATPKPCDCASWRSPRI